MKNILVTAIGSFSADCVVNSLKLNGFKVFGSDIYPGVWHAVTNDCFKVFRAPYASYEKEYINFLLKTCQENDIKYLLPLTDLEIDVINKNRVLFSEEHIVLCMPSTYTLYYARDKFATFNLFKDDEIVNVPQSVNSESLDITFPIPAIVKPVNGRSSEGLQRIYDTDELKLFIGQTNYIVQQMIDGSIYTVDFIRDSFGNDFSVPREELLRTKNGAGTTVRICPNEILQKTSSYIGNILNVVGCINMEFICNEGNYYLIDINPRFSAGIAFSNFIGYDMVENHMNAILGKEIVQSKMFEEQIICKYYKEKLLWKK